MSRLNLNGKERIGIFGGTFAPPHKGHTAAATAFVAQMNIDRLLIIPAGIPPHKQISTGDNPTHRLEMCKLAFASCPRTEISDIELKRDGKSFTYDTVRELYTPETELYLLCGTDMLMTFEQWYRFEDILKLSNLVLVRREGDSDMNYTTAMAVKHLNDAYGAKVYQLCLKARELSSTEIRAHVAAGDPITDYVDKKVAAYIANNGLYSEV